MTATQTTPAVAQDRKCGSHQLELAPRPENAIPFGGDDALERAAEAWIHSAHGRQIMRMAYAEFAIVLRQAEPGQRISMDYIIHRLRFRIRKIKCRLTRRNIDFKQSGGYALNDHHTAYISRHLTAHRPEWAARIEQRKVGVKKPKVIKTVTVTEVRQN